MTTSHVFGFGVALRRGPVASFCSLIFFPSTRKDKKESLQVQRSWIDSLGVPENVEIASFCWENKLDVFLHETFLFLFVFSH